MVIPNLMNAFAIDKVQAEYIAEIKLRNINREYILRRMQEREALEKSIKEIQETLADEKKIKALICRQLKAAAKKYGQPRRTEIIHEDEVPVLTKEDFIEDYGIRLFLTKENYFKKISLVSLRSAGEQKMKEEDSMLMELEATNRMDILFFSDHQNVYKLKASDAADTKASLLGEYLPNLLNLEEGETILYMTATLDYTGFMVFFFENGKASKVELSAYATKMNRKKLLKAYSAKAKIVSMVKLEEDADFFLVRNYDKATLFSTELLPVSVTKSAAGVQVYTLKKNSTVTMVLPKDGFVTEDPEYYRSRKIPTTGHFIQETDKEKNELPGQLEL